MSKTTGKIKVKIEKGTDKYFYFTEEKIVICTKCKREYKGRKFCLDCYKKRKKKVKTKIHIKKHSGLITIDLSKFSCDCVFGSWFRWGKHWKDNYPNSRCRHCKWAMKIIKKQG